MSKKRKIILGIVWAVTVLVLLVGIFFVRSDGSGESIQEAMKDAVLHEHNQLDLFGIKNVNPSLISAFFVTAVLLLFALIVRIFVIPRFKIIPGKFQSLIEEAVGYFDNLAKTNSPHRNKFLGAYIFGVGSYIFIGTLFELLGLQADTVSGTPIALPAPLSDINGAIAVGFISYFVILGGGIAGNGFKGVGSALKDFSLPLSMSFRLFGALLSGLLVTELVYFYLSLSFLLPVIVAVLFTILHALIQTYVLTMLTSVFYGEVSKPRKQKAKKAENIQAVA